MTMDEFRPFVRHLLRASGRERDANDREGKSDAYSRFPPLLQNQRFCHFTTREPFPLVLTPYALFNFPSSLAVVRVIAKQTYARFQTVPISKKSFLETIEGSGLPGAQKLFRMPKSALR